MRYSWLPLSLLIAACLSFVGTAVGASQSLAELLLRDAERSQSLRTQTDLQRLKTLLVDIETGQRGFIITGQQPFLRPYEEAMSELGALHARLRGQLAATGTPASSLLRLDQLVQMRVEQVRQTIARRTALGEAVMRDIGAYAEGKRVMDDLRFEIDQLGREQQRHIAAADAATEDVQQRTTRLTRLLPGIGLVMVSVALMLMFRERRLRDRAEVALREVNAGLEQQVAQRTEALSRALDRIRSFASELDRSVEAERRRLAREVHDQIGQAGTAMKMLVTSLRRNLPVNEASQLDELVTLADEAIRSARQISAELRPPLLDELGLEPALSHYLLALERQSGVSTALELIDAARLSADQATPLFRIVQEACINVLRHAGATALQVKGRPWAHAGKLGYELEVIDNGRGPGGMRVGASGLRGMRERAALAGGDLDFEPAEGGGTRVRVWLPLQTSTPVATPVPSGGDA
ncbi:CHASE3 domain-containing protein [Roseateles cellulosilyticus]|uniref:histidine kinase n=1 Tax=Pelomonas cellulosilytica TaxID=2906762 RepID=A0ABS8XSU7_9BURK|nr:CHASE3 domain-containing protein [Pelomonas sp. P8]MCE4554948.1 CHASE3 domain-containing protein [Pelomonas sp. P8]